MTFMNFFTAATPKASRTRAEGRSPRRGRAPLQLETLEVRDLKSNIPGVSLVHGMISIQATEHAGTTASVSYNGDGNVRVMLNNQVALFDASQVYSVSYTGGAGGRNTFVNDTNLYSMMYGFGGNNHFVGSSSFNVVFLYGDSNSYDSSKGANYVFAYDGPQNVFNADSNDFIYSYNTSDIYRYV